MKLYQTCERGKRKEERGKRKEERGKREEQKRKRQQDGVSRPLPLCHRCAIIAPSAASYRIRVQQQHWFDQIVDNDFRDFFVLVTTTKGQQLRVPTQQHPRRQPFVHGKSQQQWLQWSPVFGSNGKGGNEYKKSTIKTEHHYSTTVQQYNSTTVQQYNSTTVQQYNSTTVQQYKKKQIP
jgi:hypothetical protein